MSMTGSSKGKNIALGILGVYAVVITILFLLSLVGIYVENMDNTYLAEKNEKLSLKYDKLYNNSLLLADKCDEELESMRSLCNDKIKSANERTLNAISDTAQCAEEFNKLADECDDDATYTVEEKMEDLTGLINAFNPFSGLFN